MNLAKITLLAALTLTTAATTAAPAPVTLSVDTRRPAQTILGFGASGCWWAQEVGAWPDADRRALVRMLYDKKTGLGLTIYRHNLGADTRDDNTITNRKNRTESVLNTKTGKFDWTRDANARRIMRDAVDAGAEQVILFVNSPPVNMTVNGRGRCTTDPNGKKTGKGNKVDPNTVKKTTNLAPARYADFAACLGEITEHFLRVDKLPVVALSPINEPGHPWQQNNQEGCYYSPEQTAALLKKIVAEFKRRDLPVRIEPTESEAWTKAIPYYEAIRRDPELRATFTDYCLHSYGSKPPGKQQLRDWFDKNLPGARLHMSEWCDMRSSELDPGMSGALPMARTMVEDLTTGRVNTWQWWLGASPHQYRDGLLHYDNDTRKITPLKRYWVMAQFSRYLAKGSVVLPVKTPAPPEQLLAMAARLPDDRLAVIAVNLSGSAAPLDIQFPKSERWRPQLRALTDDKHNNAETPAPADTTLPPHSVLTIIFEKQQ